MKKIRSMSNYIIAYCVIIIYSYYKLGIGTNYFSTLDSLLGGFKQIDIRCIQWILIRLPVWYMFLNQMLQIENKFSFYLFIRNRSYIKLYLSTFFKSFVKVFVYYFDMFLCIGILVYTACGGSFFKGTDAGSIIYLFVHESLQTTSFCLGVYILFCLLKKLEQSFLIVLCCQIILKMIQKQDTWIGWDLIITLVLVFVTLRVAIKSFYNRIGD